MISIINDYREYCYSQKLIPNDWKKMRVQLSGTTINLNKDLNLYYEYAERGYTGHQYLGLYNNKAVRAIGKVIAIATAIYENNELVVYEELGKITKEMKSNIKKAMDDSMEFGYNLHNYENRYFFVEKFYDTDFRKITPYAPRGTRYFDLCDILDTQNLPDTCEIARQLKEKTWT